MEQPDRRKNAAPTQGSFSKNFLRRSARPKTRTSAAGAAKIRAKQWNCPSATIRVAFEDKEFIIMQAVPPAALAEKPAEKQQASGKKNLADSVEKSANGDIVVNVPMVNQGAKGYCFPATVERLLLHNGLADIDMHKLADLFKTASAEAQRSTTLPTPSRKSPARTS